MLYVLSQHPKAAASVGIKHHCHCLTCIQEKKGAGTRREESRYHFSFVCSGILMQILCYLLKEASERREGKVRPRTGPVMLWPTWMENCQMYKSKVKSNWSTLNLYQASWRTTSKNFTFHKDLCFNRHLQSPTILQHIFTVSS